MPYFWKKGILLLREMPHCTGKARRLREMPYFTGKARRLREMPYLTGDEPAVARDALFYRQGAAVAVDTVLRVYIQHLKHNSCL